MERREAEASGRRQRRGGVQEAQNVMLNAEHAGPMVLINEALLPI